MPFEPVILTGEYVGLNAVRQQQASDQQCVCVVEFHFNAALDSSAQGGEVHYKVNDQASRGFAMAMWAELAAVGLPPHGGQPVKSTAEAPNSGWIDDYRMPAILLEPLFISNAGQANWLHDNAGILADAIVRAISNSFPDGSRIGLSAGHEGRHPHDPGASCARGDSEVDHTVAMRDLVAERLS